ncbi:MAG TPA: hypothetical protein VMT08_39050 [Bradyrhizobium sp.]|nr:hypothetical protein [Bradyrhizobium sp.]
MDDGKIVLTETVRQPLAKRSSAGGIPVRSIFFFWYAPIGVGHVELRPFGCVCSRRTTLSEGSIVQK